MKLSYQHIFKSGTNPTSPPLLLLHGTGGDENDLLPLGASISPGSPLLSARGDVLENGMPRFFRRLAPGVFDFADLTKRTETLAEFITQAATTYQLDARQLIAVGYSNGANIALSVLLNHPALLAGAALLRPMWIGEPGKTPDLTGKRVLISSGLQDPIAPADQAGQIATLLRKTGASVTLNSLPAGHGLTSADFAGAKRFILTQE
jgi:phospholipase/carboxylesterase